ncbi:hypothetical protein CI109_105113 [Kwoniella shandongensis]|uniref:Uncharacterized protein n=1 Tax=Kwoniella shandongensis TaxID=1734106 RepID=A0AAJ8MZ24_9TREE
MPPHHLIPLNPNDVNRGSTSSHTPIRRVYIQNLTDLLHACLLRGDLDRAKRAWAILIRCREVDWKSRWNWGLLILSHGSDSAQPTFADYEGQDVERWLGSLRIAAKNNEKPLFLHAVVLHLIKHGRYRQALEEISTYINSYPYILSSSLHTYAGLLSFYLAQPTSQRVGATSSREATYDGTSDRISQRDESVSAASSPPPELKGMEELPNPGMMRQARGWFVKALDIDPSDDVAKSFIKLIDNPVGAEQSDEEDEEDEDIKGVDDDDDEDEDEMMDSDSEGKSDESDEDGEEDEDGSEKLERFDLSDDPKRGLAVVTPDALDATTIPT